MRAWQTIGLMTLSLAAFATAWAQDSDPRWVACSNMERAVSPDVSIAACQELIPLSSGESLGIAYYNAGNGYYDKEDYEAAVANYDEAVKTYTSFKVYRNRGLARAKIGDADWALADYDRALALEPDNLELYERRAVVFQDIGEDAKAVAEYDKIIARDPAYRDAFAWRGRLYANLGEHAKALTDLEEAVRRNPDSAEVLVSRGIAREATGDHTGALADFDKAITLDPYKGDTFFRRGNVRYGLGDYRGAVDDYSKVLFFDFYNADAYMNRAVAHIMLGETDAALNDYSSAITSKPSGTLYAYRSDLYLHKPDYPKAIADIDEAVKMIADSPSTLAAACKTRAIAGVELSVARAHCDTANTMAPNDAAVLGWRGLTKLKEGSYQAAWEDYDAGVKLEESAELLAGRGLAARLSGREAEGLADIARAKQMDAGVSGRYAWYGYALP